METHARTIVKALSWRFVATMITFTVAWIVTRKLTFAAEIGVVDTIIKLGAYYFHERIWIQIKFGQLIRPEYEI